MRLTSFHRWAGVWDSHCVEAAWRKVIETGIGAALRRHLAQVETNYFDFYCIEARKSSFQTTLDYYNK